MAQSQSASPVAAGALAFADAAKAKSPETPSHPFASGEFGSVFVATPSKPIAAHYHAKHDETVVVLRGMGKMRLGAIEREVRPGDLVFVPKGAIHDFRPSSEDCVAVSCFAPTFDGKDRVFVDR